MKKNDDYNELFSGKTIVITGGTGFLGKHLTREILKCNPKSIRIFSRDEVKHHRMQLEFSNDLNKLRFLIGDVRDYDRLNKALSGADIAIHAAALKRLDILEYNVEESIKTNIFGTLNFARACLENNVDKAVFVSTDKSCSPVNTYGACKFVSERIMIESNYNKGDKKKTKLFCVRYGNVIESTGSVIPFFENKIVNKQPIPLTDKDMTRFFITPEQAVKLVFESIRYGIGGEVFVPKLPSFKIVDLIEMLKEKHNSSSPVEIVGVRPGEKIHELMLNSTELRRTYEYANNYIIVSEIERYAGTDKPEYILKGKPIHLVHPEYSSEYETIGKESIKELFQKNGLM